MLKSLLLLALTIAPAAAFAGGCPAGHGGVDIRPFDKTGAKGVTDTVLTTINVAKK